MYINVHVYERSAGMINITDVHIYIHVCICIYICIHMVYIYMYMCIYMCIDIHAALKQADASLHTAIANMLHVFVHMHVSNIYGAAWPWGLIGKLLP